MRCGKSSAIHRMVFEEETDSNTSNVKAGMCMCVLWRTRDELGVWEWPLFIIVKLTPDGKNAEMTK